MENSSITDPCRAILSRSASTIINNHLGFNRLQIFGSGIALAFSFFNCHADQMHGLRQRTAEINTFIINLGGRLAESHQYAAMARRDNRKRRQYRHQEQLAPDLISYR